MTEDKRQRSSWLFVFVLAATAFAGCAGGYLLGRGRAPSSDESFRFLSELVVSLVHAQNFGAIVATGIAAAASIVTAAVIPAIVVFVLEYRQKRNNQERK